MSSSAATAGVYVHIPLCAVKCAHCHFAIDPGGPGEDRQERYLRAVLREIDAPRAWAEDVRRADSIYFGGGTPTLLSMGRLGRVLESLCRRFALDPEAEVTVEANPGDLDGAGYSRLRALGVNRLSVGVQAMDEAGDLAAFRARHGVDRLVDYDAAPRAVTSWRLASETPVSGAPSQASRDTVPGSAGPRSLSR
jgi:coproporphyrinogen III oxidase-like Fe-S oxidoreductase